MTIPPSVYLNAARAYDRQVNAQLGNPPGAPVLSTAGLAATPTFRAAVESVWEERGGHVADAIRRVREMARHPWWAAGHWYVTLRQDELFAALDAQRPAEGGPEKCDCDGSRCPYPAGYAPAALDSGQPATGAEPATDRGTGRPCTIYVPPEYCSDPYRCRVHRGAYPPPATEETP